MFATALLISLAVCVLLFTAAVTSLDHFWMALATVSLLGVVALLLACARLVLQGWQDRDDGRRYQTPFWRGRPRARHDGRPAQQIPTDHAAAKRS